MRIREIPLTKVKFPHCIHRFDLMRLSVSRDTPR
jgi:hypothetical protein